MNAHPTRGEATDGGATPARHASTEPAALQEGAAPPSDPRSAPSRWQLGYLALALAGVLAVLYAWRLWPFQSHVIETENALVRGQVTVVGTQLSGYVDDVLVSDFERVEQGQVLARIDARGIRQRVAQTRAQLASHTAALANWPQRQRTASANLVLAKATLAGASAQAARAAADLRRADDLAADGSLSLREQDQARAALAQARAAVAQGGATIDIARQAIRSVAIEQAALQAAHDHAAAVLGAALVELDNTEIVAPVAGQLGQVSVRRGAFVQAGAQLMGLVPPEVWVIANFKETQMNAVAEGQAAVLMVDALDGARLQGRVARVSPATGGEFSVLPADNATGNFLKIAQRIPVRITLLPGQALAGRLRPGMSVVVRVDTGARR